MSKNGLLKNFKINLSNDIVIENQRGLTVLGYTLYSPHLLFPGIDPPQYQIVYCEPGDEEADNIILNSLSNKILSSFEQLYPIDFNPAKETIENTKWYILMSIEDTDDQGWNYSWSFRSKRWKYKNGLVRRRVWVKLPAE